MSTAAIQKGVTRVEHCSFRLGFMQWPGGTSALAFEIWVALAVSYYIAFILELNSAASAGTGLLILVGLTQGMVLSKVIHRIAGTTRDVQRKPGEADGDHPPYPPPVPVSDLSGKRAYDYIPSIGVESRWHPYKLDWNAPGEPAFEQWGSADYSLQKPRPMPHPEAEVLKAGTLAAPQPHAISAATMADGGLELERRWELARDMQGRPVLWIQRQRRILRNAPARTLLFDVMSQTAPQA